MVDIIPLNPPQKQCTKCLKWKDATPYYFNTTPKGLYGVVAVCKVCKSKAWKEKHPNAKTQVVDAPPLPDGFKRCAKCRKELPATLECFGKHSNGGLQPRCKQCRAGDNKIYHDTNGDAVRQRSRINQPRYHERRVAYNNARKDIRNARRREQYSTNPLIRESRLESGRADYRKHKTRHKATKDIYRIANREYYRLKDRERDIRERGVTGTHTVEQLKAQFKRQKGKCYYCSKKLKWGEHEVEHTYPISRVAGTDTPANGIDYLVLSCKHCNCSKNNKYPWEWPQGNRLM